MDPKQIIFVIVRMIATPIIVWLAANSQISETQATNVIVAVLWVAVMTIWSIANKWWSGVKVEKALEMKAGSTTTDLKEALKF